MVLLLLNMICSVRMLCMLKIRLKRVGRKHDPSFRIVVTEKHLGPKSGKYIENVGFYNVLKGDKTLNGERIKYWMSKGAQVSNTVHNLLISEGVIEGKKKNVLPNKTPILKEKTDAPEEKEAPATEAVEAKEEAPSAEATEAKEAPAKEEVTPPAETEEKKEEAPTEETKTEEA